MSGYPWWQRVWDEVTWRLSSVRRVYRQVRWFWQRGRRGYSDLDAVSLDAYLCSWLPDAIRQIGQYSHPT